MSKVSTRKPQNSKRARQTTRTTRILTKGSVWS